MPGKFIVIDGPDGCGKSTQVKLLADYLTTQELKVLKIREPGSTHIGEQIRKILLNPVYYQMSIKTELFLYMASRSQLVDEVIKPALRQGKIIVCERFLSSTIVYQGWAGGVGIENVRKAGRIAIDNIQPHLTIILDIKPEDGLKRITQPRVRKSPFRRKGNLDRMELKMLSFHRKVRRGFLLMAKQDPCHFKVINAYGPINQVQSQIRKVIKDVLRILSPQDEVASPEGGKRVV